MNKFSLSLNLPAIQHQYSGVRGRLFRVQLSNRDIDPPFYFVLIIRDIKFSNHGQHLSRVFDLVKLTSGLRMRDIYPMFPIPFHPR